MHIGLVLASVPGYSETFFRNKIQALRSAGISVTLFVDRKSAGADWSLCPIAYNKPLSGAGHFFRNAFWALGRFALHSMKTFKLVLLNHRSGFSWKHNLQSLFQSIHILPYRVQWLHFGFGTMALGRENLARVLGAKMAVSFRGFDHYVYPLKNPGCYRILFQHVKRIHVLSHAMKADLIRQGVNGEFIFVITPAIDVTYFRATAMKKFSHPLRITTVARLHWIKGLEYTLEALALLKGKGIDFQYTLIGEGEERERLLFAIHQLGLKNNVSVAGSLPPAEVMRHLSDTDLYLQYSIQEGFCNSVLEAQAMGLLCIVSNAEGLMENIHHRETGWVVQGRSPVALANQIQEVVNMEVENSLQVRKNAQSRVHQSFGLENQCKLFLEFYELTGEVKAL